MTALTPSASYTTTMRVEIADRPGALAEVLTAVGDAGGMLGAIDIVRADRARSVRDVTFSARDSDHVEKIRAAVARLPGVEVANVSDRTFLLHLGGKIEVVSKSPIRTRDDLSMVYTPGVARVSEAIAADPEASFNLTIRANTVAVVSDGTAVLGLGNIGPEAALPVMEGKAALFKEFAGINAFPICLSTTDPDEIVRCVQAIAPSFGGINLEDISAPRCFDVEQRLKDSLDIPVFHDDQHGTAVVLLAALENALKVVGKELSDIRVAVLGLGAAGIACSKILLSAGIGDLVGIDREGIIHRGLNDLPPHKHWLAQNSNHAGITGGLEDAMRGADVFIGVAGPGIVDADQVALMADGAIVFALSNPVPEIMPEVVRDNVAVMATGRSDYPNQINNVLCFPGMFKGALGCRASSINEDMKLVAADAIAAVISETELSADYIVPSVFDTRVVDAVAGGVGARLIEGRRREVGAGAAGLGQFGQQCHQDDARPGAEIEDGWPGCRCLKGMRAGKGEGALDQRFGIGTRIEAGRPNR
ncbi:MAG: NAD-dependent malic enzyme, partial [Actinobacteria bacterium]|nr:NAD-dependent malic enzyme [Actinomycetota bacterium]